jgi:hypothetical protein
MAPSAVRGEKPLAPFCEAVPEVASPLAVSEATKKTNNDHGAKMQTRFYFPVSLDEAIAVMRKGKRLDRVRATEEHTFFAYTDRDLAIRQTSQNVEHFGEEFWIVVVEVPTPVVNDLLMGDGVHYGPLAHWRSPHIMEIEAAGEGILTHHARLSLEIVPRGGR